MKIIFLSALLMIGLCAYFIKEIYQIEHIATRQIVDSAQPSEPVQNEINVNFSGR